MRRFFQDFKEFALKGNLLDLAVAVILGLAFNAVVQSVVKNIVTPVIAAVGGKPDFNSLRIGIGKSAILIGAFLNDLLNFIIIAFVLFLIVKAALRFQQRPEVAACEQQRHGCRAS